MRTELLIGSLLSALFFFGAFQSSTSIQPLPQTPPTTVESAQQTSLTKETVALHNTPSDCWMIVNSMVYNVTSYLPYHPGGSKRITPYCGTDGTEAFATQGGEGTHSNTANTDLKRLEIGALDTMVTQQRLDTIPTQTARRDKHEYEREDD